MKRISHKINYAKCNLMGVAYIAVVVVMFYVMGTRFYDSYTSGNIKFKYHSNVFYGKEAVVMYVSYSLVLVALLALSYISVKKCYKNQKNRGNSVNKI